MVYKALKKIIRSGKFDREDMLNKLGIFLQAGRITQAEYTELTEMAGE